MSRRPDPLPAIDWAGGMRLRGTPLSLDAVAPAELCFVSHAHLPRAWQHQRILATERTVKLWGDKIITTRPLLCTYRRPFALGDLEIELFPAGHMLGSAQIRVRTPPGDLVYTGDLCLDGSRTAERAQVVPCDVLVIDATFGHPRCAFPPRAEAEAHLLAWVRGCFARGATPVLYASEAGKAQELLKLLGDHGIISRVHAGIYGVCRLYRECGVELSGVKRFRGTPATGEVVIFPPRLQGSRAISALKKIRTAVATGWAMVPERRARLGVDETFPLSGHADFPALLRYVDLARPSRVYAFGAHAEEFADVLRGRGIEASVLAPPEQMRLL
jgi:putative mRNA 3-end processing factor